MAQKSNGWRLWSRTYQTAVRDWATYRLTNCILRLVPHLRTQGCTHLTYVLVWHGSKQFGLQKLVKPKKSDSMGSLFIFLEKGQNNSLQYRKKSKSELPKALPNRALRCNVPTKRLQGPPSCSGCLEL